MFLARYTEGLRITIAPRRWDDRATEILFKAVSDQPVKVVATMGGRYSVYEVEMFTRLSSPRWMFWKKWFPSSRWTGWVREPARRYQVVRGTSQLLPHPTMESYLLKITDLVWTHDQVEEFLFHKRSAATSE